MGAFRSSMTLIAVIGRRYSSADLRDILIESGVLAHGSVDQVLNGRQYNRAFKSLKIVYEALWRLNWSTFLAWNNGHDNPLDLVALQDEVTLVKSDCNAQTVNNLLKSHVIFFYFLPVYLLAMRCLPDTHPSRPIHNHLSAGGFVAHLSASIFSGIAHDQTIEMTINKDTKTSGGLIGRTMQHNAVSKWMWTAVHC